MLQSAVSGLGLYVKQLIYLASVQLAPLPTGMIPSILWVNASCVLAISSNLLEGDSPNLMGLYTGPCNFTSKKSPMDVWNSGDSKAVSMLLLNTYVKTIQ